MAENNKLKQAKPNPEDIIKTHNAYMANVNLRSKFDEVLGDSSASFMTSVINIIKQSELLQACEPISIWNAALCAATMRLPIEPNFGYAYIVPYKDNASGTTIAQFQMGAKGYHQLALRTGEYVTINKSDVREGELKRRNRLTGQIEFEWIQDEEERLKAPIIGYVSYFELRNGYTSTLYMSMAELMDHAKRYSKLYQNDLKYGKKNSKWSVEEERGKMCEKTVAKLNLAKNGILSVDLQRAMTCDNAAIDENGNPSYVDNIIDENGAPIDNEAAVMTGEFSDVFGSGNNEAAPTAEVKENATDKG